MFSTLSNASCSSRFRLSSYINCGMEFISDNRLIRRYLPKGTPITSYQPYLDAIAYELNNCPRATLGYRTHTEAFNELIATTH